MRILLDAKDLINIVELRRPMSTAEFARWMEQRGAVLVLSLTSVSDFVGPVFSRRGDWLQMRSWLQTLESLPVVYIREGSIIRDELSEALRAYQVPQEPSPANPYVPRWDETAYWEGGAATKILVGLRLDEIVYMARGAIQAYKRYTRGLQSKLAWERSLPPSKRQPLRDIFVNNLPDRLRAYKIDPAGVPLPKFGSWLWNSPLRCPGLRFQFEVYHQLRRDETMRLQEGDIADFAHLAAVPYVHVATVDKRIADLATKASKKLGRNDTRADFSGKLFKNVDEILSRFS